MIARTSSAISAATCSSAPREAALEALTRAPAQILGLGDRVGSLESGKDADLVLYDGDPFEYTTQVCTVIVNGDVVSDSCQ